MWIHKLASNFSHYHCYSFFPIQFSLTIYALALLSTARLFYYSKLIDQCQLLGETESWRALLLRRNGIETDLYYFPLLLSLSRRALLAVSCWCCLFSIGVAVDVVVVVVVARFDHIGIELKESKAGIEIERERENPFIIMWDHCWFFSLMIPINYNNQDGDIFFASLAFRPCLDFRSNWRRRRQRQESELEVEQLSLVHTNKQTNEQTNYPPFLSL